MKLLWLLLAVGIAAQHEDWVEEEELEEPYNEYRSQDTDEESYRTRRHVYNEPDYNDNVDQERESYRARREFDHKHETIRTRRDVHDEGPYEEHIRVKRCTYEHVPVSRVRRSTEFVRVPRQIHQYEVHEVTDDGYPTSPPYEEMLAASAEHYHKVYAAPGAPSSARYLNPEVSAIPIVYRPVPSVPSVSNQNFQPSTHNVQYHPVPTQNSPHVASKQFVQNAPKHPLQTKYVQNAPNHPVPVQFIQNTPKHPVPIQNARQQFDPTQYSPSPIKFVEPVQFVPVKASIKVADAPSSVKSPLGIVQASGLGPVPQPGNTAPVATVEAVPLVGDQHKAVPLVDEQNPAGPLAGDQQEAAAVVKHHQHATGHRQGGGRAKHAHHDAHRGGKTSKGFKHDHHVDKGAKGFKEDELHRKEYEEAQGKQKKHHDHADHKGSHEEQAHGHKGSKFDEKKGHKKGHKTKGYHNKYHKDEFHKEHKFYDDYHKSGEHHRYGKFNAKHASNESGKKKAHHVNAGHDFVERGKKGYSNKGHLDADHKGYNGKAGHEEHHEKHSSHGKKGGKEGGAQWSHGKKN